MPQATDQMPPVPAREVWYIAITDFPSGLGSTTRTRSICDAIAEGGQRIRLLIPYAIGHMANDAVRGTFRGYEYEYVNGSTRRPTGALRVAATKLASGLRLACRLWRHSKTVSAVMLYNSSLFDAWPILLVARVLGIRSIVDLTDDWRDPSRKARDLGYARYWFQRLAVGTEWILFAMTDRIIVVSRLLERRLAPWRDKLVKLPVVFDPAPFTNAVTRRRNRPPGEFVVLYAGNLSRIEGVPVLIDAVARTLPHIERLGLSLVGNTTMGERPHDYRDHVDRLGLSGRVSFAPAVSYSDYPHYLRGADILAIPRTTHPLSNAGFPYKLAEYLAAGVPVVATRFGDIEEYFTDRVHCVLCDPDDPGSLGEGIEWVYDHPNLARAMALAGQGRSVELFGRATVGERLVRLVRGE
jgi:glycosyltransferase involved in cell wall biosynthesis